MLSTRVWRFSKCGLSILLVLTMLGGMAVSPVSAASVTWVLNADGFWEIATNWSSDPLLPGVSDDVTINVGGNQTITHSSGTDTINSLNMPGDDILAINGTGSLTISNAFTNNANTNISGASLILNGASTVGSLTQSSGSIAGTGTLTVTGATNITFGDMQGTGTTILNGPTTIASSALYLDAGRTLHNNATLTWTGGAIDLNYNLNGVSLPGAGAIINSATGTFVMDGNNNFSVAAFNFGGTDTGAEATFTNAGTVRKQNSDATSTTTVGVLFTNSGTVDVQTGTLSLANGGTHSGNFTGAGTIGFGGGTHSVSGNITTANAAFSGGTTTVTGTYNVAGTTTVNGGTAELTGATLASLGTALNISGGLLNLGNSGATVGSLTQSSGSIAGTGTLTVTGATNITFGDMQGTGTTILNGPTTIASSALYLDAGRTLHNNATLTWTGGAIDLNYNLNGVSLPGAGAIINSATGTFVMDGNNNFSVAAFNFGGTDTGAEATFTNAGTVRKQNSDATSTTTVFVPFTNSGTVDVQTGTLSLANGGTHSGTFNVASGAVLQFAGGTHDINGGSITSAGTTRVNAGTVNLNVPYSIAGTTEIQGGVFNVAGGASSTGALTMSSGSLQGASTFTINGATNITFGDMQGTGTTILNGPTTIASSALYLDAGRTLHNNATLTWTGGAIDLNYNLNGVSLPGAGAIINSATGTFVMDGNNNFSVAAFNFGGTDTGAEATFTNAGTVRKQNSDATSTTTVGVLFTNSGTVDVQTGTLSLANGGTHSGNFTGAGTIGFGGGTHSVSGNITTANAAFSGGTTTVTGTYNVAGTTTVNGGTAELTGATLASLGTALNISGGLLNLGNSGATVGSLTQSSGSIAGTGTLTVTGATNITFGDMQGTGTTILNGPTTIASSALYLDAGRTLHNNATLTWTGGAIDLNYNLNGVSLPGAGAIINSATGTFVMDGNNNFSVAAFNFGGTDTGAEATFTNAGTVRKQNSDATSTTTVFVPFTNSGTVDVQTGTLSLANGGTHSGTFNVASGAVLQFAGGTHDINGGSITSAGTTRVNAGTVNLNVPYSIAGTTEIQGGVFNVAGGASSTGALTMSSGSLQGASTFTINGATNITFGDMQGTGTTILNGPTTIASSALYLDAGRTLHNNATLTWTGGAIDLNYNLNGVSLPGAGTLTNSATGTFVVDGNNNFSVGAFNFGGTDTGAEAAFTNAGTVRKQNSDATSTTTVGVLFTNSGTVDVQTGILSLTGASSHTAASTLTVASGATLDLNTATHTLNGGTVNTAGTVRLSNGVLNLASPQTINGTGTFQMTGGSVQGAALTINTATDITFGDMQGTGTTILNGPTTIASSGLYLDAGRTLHNNATLTWTGGEINLNYNLNGASLPGAGTLTNSATGTFVVDGNNNFSLGAFNFGGTDTGAEAAFTNAGTVRKQNSDATSTTTVGVLFTNSGTVDVQTGILSFSKGIQGSTGTVQTASGAQLTIDTASVAGSLINNGTVNLGANSFTIHNDYNNANFGSGNSFNARANITGTGQILAAGTLSQAQVITATSLLPGSNLTGGGTAAPTLTIGNVHVGNTTIDYQIANNNIGGPAIRGAIQTAVEGANITDARLSGSGVTAGNFGPIAAGSNANFHINFNVAGAGALAPLSGQVVRIANNFDNVDEQNMSIVLGAGAAAYRLAASSAHTPEPVNLGNMHVGTIAQQALSLTNQAANDGFSEKLNASLGGATAGVTATGSFTLLNPQATNNSSLIVGLNTATAGAKSGTATITLQSDGTGTSGLGITGLPSQPVNITGNVFRLADPSAHTPEPVNLGNVHVGAIAQQALSLTNQAANDGFSEKLNASLGGATAGVTATGSFSQLGPQATNNTSLIAGLDTATAGAKSGTATISLQSDGTGTSGLGITALPSQTVNITGNVFRLAEASAHSPEPVNLGNVHVGGIAQQALSLTNTAANDGFSEKLNASLGGATAGVTATGSFSLLGPQAMNNTGLVVGIDTATAGAKVGTATISLQSDGTGTSGLGTTVIPSQTVNISGNVFRLAAAGAHTPEPVSLGNVHVGGSAQQALSITNTAANDGFSEKLNASIGSATAGVMASGSFSLLGPQATNSIGLVVGLDTTTAGAKSGTATISLQSDGTGTSGLGTTALSAQTVNITGNVFRLAQANTLSPVSFGVVHVGDTVQQALSVSNIAANDGFSEKLHASFGGTSDARIITSGTMSLLAPGATNNSSLLVGLDTSAAGVVSGTATVHFQSDGAGTSGLGLTNLPSQNVGVSGDIQTTASVFRLAHATPHTPEPVTLGNVHVGAIATQALTIGNDALNDGFSEKLNGSMTTNTPGVITATGSFTLLPPGAPGNLAAIDSTSLVVGINTATAGAKSGTATLSLQSDGTGTSGLGTTSLGTQTVTVSGNVFRLAAASAHTPEPVSLGNVHVGDTAQQALSLTNTAANDGFSEKLNASLGGATAGVTATGSFSQLGPQATNNTNLIAGLDTSTAGAKSGTATISLQSDGTGTSDLGTTALSAQTVSITGNVFRLAAASTHTPEPVTLGNVRIGTVATQAFTLSNTAPNDGFSEKLNGSITSNAPGVITAGGSFTLLLPGAPGNPAATDSTSLVVGMNTATAGAKNGTATITLASDGTGTSGLGITALPAQTVNVSGNVFRLADPSAHTPEPVSFANVHVGDIAQQALSLSNQAANDGFSEKLNASLDGATVGVTASGSFSLLGPQATNTTALVVGLDTATAGAKNGTATITLSSDGTGTSGLAALALTPQTVNISGNVFRLAAAGVHTPEPVTFANVHVGETAQQALSLTNTAANDGFSEKLTASLGGATAGVTASGSFSLLGPQATNNTSLIAGLDTATAGAKSGTATITLQSDGTGTSGLGTTALSAQTVTITGNVFRLAQANTLSPVSFGVVHVGDTVQQALSVSNIAANDGFSEKLHASFGGTSDARIITSGTMSLLAPGATNNSSLLVGLDTSAAGVVSGTATVHFQSDGAGTSGLGLTNLPSQNVGVSGDIQTTASVFRLAHATLHTPEPVSLGNVHVGAIATQALTIGNDALNDGFSEKLNGSMTTNTPGVITATGSFTLLPPGAPGNLAAIDSTSLVVGINTATAGAKSGTATLSLQSDGTGTSGLGTTSLGTQTVTVSGNVFRLAAASAHTPEPVTFANVHVGDTAQQALSLMNTAATDGFSEKLNASLGGATAGITATGSFSLLGPQATNTTDLVVGLDTSTAGAKSGMATITLQSDGTGTSGLGTTALPAQTVTTTGNVFRLAQANTLSPVNFGVVHVGDTVQQALSISNTAANDSFSEKLNASFGATSDTRITTSGAISLLGPGATDNSSMSVSLNTSAAGFVNGTATVHFQSDGTGTSGLGLTHLPSQTVPTILAQINNFASPAFLQTTGAGTFSGSGTNYQLDFGTITKGSSALSAALSALNNVTGPADLLDGAFLLNFGTRQEFGFTGFTPFTNLAAGQSFAGHIVTFDPTHLGPGAFNDLVVLKGTGHNASGFSGALPDVSLHIQGTVDPNGVFDAIWNGGTGNYSIANKWDINTVPNNGVPPGSRYNVLIDGAKTGTASDVSLDINATINNLTIDAGDKLGINASKSLTIAGGTMTNSGSLLIETGSTFNLDNGATYTQTAGLTTVNGSLTATLDGITDVSIMGGTLAGTGTITADVLLSGMFSPGNSPGLLSIAGDYTQTRFGELDIEIGGLTAGSQFDQLRIGGLATLDGTLRINFLNGFAPSVGDSFEFLDFLGTHQGAFGTLTSNVPGIQFRIDYNGTNTTLVVTQVQTSADVPEPATVLLMLSGLLGLLVSRRFVRRQQRRMQE